MTRQEAINVLDTMRYKAANIKMENKPINEGWSNAFNKTAGLVVKALDMAIEALSTQSEQIKMIKEIRKWINSGNRGDADYFIVDKIEEIINKYE